MYLFNYFLILYIDVLIIIYLIITILFITIFLLYIIIYIYKDIFINLNLFLFDFTLKFTYNTFVWLYYNYIDLYGTLILSDLSIIRLPLLYLVLLDWF